MRSVFVLALALLLSNCSSPKMNVASHDIISPKDRLSNPQVLTTKTGSYPSSWSSDGRYLAFWNNLNGGPVCSRAYILDLNDPQLEMGRATQVSPGYGRAIDPEFLPGDSLLMFTTTHLFEIKECEGDTVKPFFLRMRSTQTIFTSTREGLIMDPLISSNASDGQARVSPRNNQIVFTSNRAASFGLWRCNLDGSNPVPTVAGFYFAGEPRFSADGEYLVFRGRRKAPEGNEGYLRKDIDLTKSDIFMCRWNGEDIVRLTNLKAASGTPCFHPDGEHIIFSSNHHRSDGKRNLFMLNINAHTLQQITSGDADESHPIVHPSGKSLAYSALSHGDREVFMADLFME